MNDKTQSKVAVPAASPSAKAYQPPRLTKKQSLERVTLASGTVLPQGGGSFGGTVGG